MDELITSDNISNERLALIFDAADMDYELNYDTLTFYEEIEVLVIPETPKIRLVGIFDFDFDSTKRQRFEFVNQINDEFDMICACVDQEFGLVFRYDLWVDEGVTDETFALSTARFSFLVNEAIEIYGEGVVDI